MPRAVIVKDPCRLLSMATTPRRPAVWFDVHWRAPTDPSVNRLAVRAAELAEELSRTLDELRKHGIPVTWRPS